MNTLERHFLIDNVKEVDWVWLAYIWNNTKAGLPLNLSGSGLNFTHERTIWPIGTPLRDPSPHPLSPNCRIGII